MPWRRSCLEHGGAAFGVAAVWDMSGGAADPLGDCPVLFLVNTMYECTIFLPSSI